MDKLIKITYKAASIVAIVSMIGYLTIAILSFVDAVMTKFFMSPISGTMEIVEILMLISVFASFAYAQAKKAHITMPILIERLPRRLRLLILLCTSGLSIYISVYLAYAAFGNALLAQNTAKMTTILYIEMYPFYYIQAVAIVFFTFVLILDTVVILLALWSDKYNLKVIDDFDLNNVKELRTKQS